MKIAKASEADIEMSIELAGYMESIERGYMPSGLIEDDDDCEWIDTEDAAQYDRLIDGLQRLLRKGSIGRVVWGMATVCGPANKLLDHGADVLEIHPDIASAAEQRDELLAALECIASYQQIRTDEICSAELRDIASLAIASIKYKSHDA